MLVLEVFRFIKRRMNSQTVRLENFISMSEHHGSRKTEPAVAIVVPTRDKYELLFACIESIKNNTAYANFEILVVNNESSEPSTLDYLALLSSQGHTVLDFPEPFNFSKICNFAASKTSAEFLCFLNNDTQVIEGAWLGNMVDHCLQQTVGVVGSHLIYPSGKIQHIGVSLGLAGVAGHPYSGDFYEGFGFKNSCFEVSAITFACAMVSRLDYIALGGLSEGFKVGLNDVDFSLRAENAGLQIVSCGASPLIHHESKSRKSMRSFSGANQAAKEVLRLLGNYKVRLKRDKFFR